MKEIQNASKTPEKELKFKRHHNCFSPGCRNLTFLRDWAGWVWCTKHYWRQLWLNEQKGRRMFFLRHTQVN